MRIKTFKDVSSFEEREKLVGNYDLTEYIIVFGENLEEVDREATQVEIEFSKAQQELLEHCTKRHGALLKDTLSFLELVFDKCSDKQLCNKIGDFISNFKQKIK